MKTMLRVIFFALSFFPFISFAGSPAPIIDFSADQTVGCGSVTATFTDESFETSGDPFVGWLWDFGDGTTSTAYNPTHTYNSAGSYTVKLTITAQSNWTGSKSKSAFITVGTPPPVDLGPDTTFCTGTSVILSAETTGATYLWGDGSTTDPQVEVYFSGEYTVQVFRDGCESRDTIEVYEGAQLYADFSYSQNGSCTPIATQFSEYTEACSGSVVQWAWNFGDGTTSSTRNPLHNYMAAGDYNVTLTVKKNTGSTYTTTKQVSVTGDVTPVVDLGTDITLCEGSQVTLSAGNAGATYNWNTGEQTADIDVFTSGLYKVTVTNNACSAEDSVNVIVKPALWSDFNFSKISGCVPVDMQFSDNSSACQSTVVDWFWQFGDGTTSNQRSPIHTFNLAGSYTVRLTITDDNGSQITRGKKVTIDPPTFSVDLGKDTTICFGEAVTLNAGNPGATYLWSTGETSPTIDVMDDGDYTVAVTMDGCSLKDTVSVKTATSAIADWSSSIGGNCLPVAVNFSDSSKVYCGQIVKNWKWDFGDGSISTQKNPHHIYQTADSFVVRLTITASNGNIVSKTKKVYVTNTVPVVDLANSITTCRGASVRLDAQQTGAQYYWTPAAPLSAVDIQTPTATPTRSEWFKVQVTKCNVTVEDSIFVIVDSIGKPVIRQDGNILRTADASSYQWYFEGKPAAGGTGKSLRVDHSGNYTVKVKNSSGCGNESLPYFYIPVSGEEKELGGLRIKCSPNPTHGIVNILLSQIPEKPAKVMVIDANGRRLFSTYIQGHVNTLNGLQLSKGIYFIDVTFGKDRKLIPVIVQ